MPTPAKRWWRTFKDPELQKPLYLILYVVSLATGIVTLVNPPSTIQYALGPVLMAATAVMWLVGGGICLVTIFNDWWWLERLGLVLQWGGLIAYFGTVLMLHIESSAGSRLTQLGVIIMATISVVSRFLSIKEWSFAPPHLARR